MQVANRWPARGSLSSADGVEANDIAATVDRELGFRCWRNTRFSEPLSHKHAVGEPRLLPLIYIRLSTSTPRGLEDWGRSLGFVFGWHETLAGRGLSFDLLAAGINILRLTCWLTQHDGPYNFARPSRTKAGVSTAGTLPDYSTAECAPRIL